MSREKIGIGLAVLAAGVLALAPGASATTWSGTCDMKGHTDLSPPIHPTPEPTDFQTYLSGSCAGTLDGKPFNGPASSYTDGRMGQPQSCLFAAGREMWSQTHFGSADFDDVNVTILDGYTTLEVSLTTQTPFAGRGAYGGYAVGQATALGDSQKLFDQCNGPGLASVPVELKTQTLTTNSG